MRRTVTPSARMIIPRELAAIAPQKRIHFCRRAPRGLRGEDGGLGGLGGLEAKVAADRILISSHCSPLPFADSSRVSRAIRHSGSPLDPLALSPILRPQRLCALHFSAPRVSDEHGQITGSLR